jgi:exonuclease VII large subunit
MANKSAIQRIKELDEERAKMFEQARKEAFENAKAAIAELNSFGPNYTLARGFADWILST